MLKGYLSVQDTWCWWAEPRKAIKLDIKMCVWREGKEEKEEGNHTVRHQTENKIGERWQVTLGWALPGKEPMTSSARSQPQSCYLI